MLDFSTHEGRLLDWLIQQNRGGLFPRKKGWKLRIGIFRQADLQAYLAELKGEEEQIRFLILEGENLPIKLKADWAGQGQGIILTDQKNSQNLLPLAEASDSSLLALHEDRAHFVQGGFTNKRLEFRVQDQSYSFGLIPQRMGSLPQRGIGGEASKALWQNLFHLLHQQLVQGHRQQNLEKMIQGSYPLWPLLQKLEKKQFILEISQVIEEISKMFFQDLWIWKATPTGGSLEFTFSHKNKKEIQQFMRAEQQALQWLRFEQPQLDLFSKEG